MFRIFLDSLNSAWRWTRKKWDGFGPDRRIQIIEGDGLPPKLPKRDRVLAREDEKIGV
jgi:hypothetical protein